MIQPTTLLNTGDQQVTIVSEALPFTRLTISTKTLQEEQPNNDPECADLFQGVFTAEHARSVINKQMGATGHVYRLPTDDTLFLCYVVLSRTGEVHCAICDDRENALQWCIDRVGLPDYQPLSFFTQC